jgi:hypothetical protein
MKVVNWTHRNSATYLSFLIKIEAFTIFDIEPDPDVGSVPNSDPFILGYSEPDPLRTFHRSGSGPFFRISC